MSDDYEIGYGKPPAAHRFQKGRSGNPKGRKKQVKTTLMEDLDEVLAECVELPVNGKTTVRTLKEVIVEQVAEKAAQGDKRALKAYLAMRDDGENCVEPNSIFINVPESDRGF